MFSSSWGVPNDQIEICPNPLSKKFNVNSPSISEDIPEFLIGKFVMIYVSRFYSYKNHELILNIAKHLKSKKIGDIVFLVTIDKWNIFALNKF